MTERLYYSPRGLFEFQALGVARCYFERDSLAVWDTGIGKTHLAMALAAVLFEDDLIDQVVVAAEANKIRDWVEDFGRFTKIEADRYHGTKARREKMRAALPPVIVSTYETIRNDGASRGRSKNAHWIPGPLTEALVGKRVLLVFDEVTKLGNRGSGLYKAMETVLRELRKANPEETRTLGMTATPIEKDPSNVFNQARLISPETVGTVAEFAKEHIAAYDIHDNPIRFKNIGAGDHELIPGQRTLKEKLAPLLQVKSKFDQDVKDQFPKQVEEFESVTLGAKHLDFYRTVEESFYEQEWSEMEERQIFGVLRQIAGHPMALSRSQGKIAQMITEQIGVEGLRALGCAKLDAVTEYLKTVVFGQGAKAIVFTFYGQSILHLIHEHLRINGFDVVINHGGMSTGARQESIHALRYGDAQVFLSSDAGSKGLNLPEATYVLNYELPLTYANYRQRNDRVHRIDSLAEIVVTRSFVAENTVEEAIVDLVMRRNKWHDLLLSDEDEAGVHLSAADRKALIKMAYAA